jgi:hypothetical protein
MTLIKHGLSRPIKCEGNSQMVAAGGDREGRLLDLSYSAKERQREAPLTGHDGS